MMRDRGFNQITMPATATKPETLTAIFLEESHRWDSTAILRCEVRAEKAEESKRPVP